MQNVEDGSEHLLECDAGAASLIRPFVRHDGEIHEGFLNRRLDDATSVVLFAYGKAIQGQRLTVGSRATAGVAKRIRRRVKRAWKTLGNHGDGSGDEGLRHQLQQWRPDRPQRRQTMV